jgi:hypothetical protein
MREEVKTAFAATWRQRLALLRAAIESSGRT